MKILIIDDHPLFREALSYVLHKLEEKVCVLEAPDFDTALLHIRENPDIDLTTLDLHLPVQDGFTALDSIKQAVPAMPVVVISSSDHRHDIKRALEAGARGYITKCTEGLIMLNALRLILSGGIYTPPNISSSKTQLTPRQIEVLELLLEGLSNKVIAARMEVAEATVKMHVTSIFKVFGVSNRTQAAMAAKAQGYV